MNLKTVLSVMVIGAVLIGCAGPTAKRPKRVPPGFASGSWTLAADEFTRGEMDGLIFSDGTLHLSPDAQQGTFVSRVFDTGAQFDALTFSLQPSTFNFQLLTFQARSSPDEQNWSPWIAQSPDLSGDSKDGDDADYGQITPVVAGRYLQVRLILVGSDPDNQPAVRDITLDYVYAAAGPSMYQAKSAALPAQPEPGVPRPTIIPRAGWGADERMMTWKPTYRHPVRVVIHHTVTPNDEENPAATVRAIYYFHAITRKWGDIGYNYLIDWQGNIYEGRAGGEQVVGGHARGCNEGSVGISLMGTFMDHDMTPAMHQSLIDLLAWVTARYGIDPQGQSVVYERTLSNIMGHRAVAKTSCPGNTIYPQLDNLRAEVAAVVEQYGGIAAITATSAPVRSRPTRTPMATPTPVAVAQATETPQPEITTTLLPVVEITATPPIAYVTMTPSPEISETPLPAQSPIPNLQSPTPQSPTPPSPIPNTPTKIIITGLELQPYPPVASRPITLVVHLTNPGPDELTQVSVQVLFDTQMADSGQIGLAWQLDRLRAGQEATLISPLGSGLVLTVGAHQLSVRAAGRDQSGQMLAGEWGPLAVSVLPANDVASHEGWRSVLHRWGAGLSQAWKAFQEWISRQGNK